MPEMKHVHLIKFKQDELIFDEDETKDILAFFYPRNSAILSSSALVGRQMAQRPIVIPKAALAIGAKAKEHGPFRYRHGSDGRF